MLLLLLNDVIHVMNFYMLVVLQAVLSILCFYDFWACYDWSQPEILTKVSQQLQSSSTLLSALCKGPVTFIFKTT